MSWQPSFYSAWQCEINSAFPCELNSLDIYIPYDNHIHLLEFAAEQYAHIRFFQLEVPSVNVTFDENDLEGTRSDVQA